MDAKGPVTNLVWRIIKAGGAESVKDYSRGKMVYLLTPIHRAATLLQVAPATQPSDLL